MEMGGLLFPLLNGFVRKINFGRIIAVAVLERIYCICGKIFGMNKMM